MGGAQPLAATFAGAVLADHRMPAAPHRLPPAHALPRRAGERPRRRAGAHRALHRGEGRRVSIGLLGNAAEILPELVRARRRSGPTSSPTRPRAHDLINGYLPPGWSVERWQRRAGRPGAARRAARRRGRRLRRARAGDARLPGDGRADGRLRQQHPPGRVRRRRRRTRSTIPGFVPAYIRPLFCRGIGPVPLGRAVRRPGGHPQDRREDEGAVPRRRAPAPLARHGRRAHRLPGPAGAHLLDRPGRAPPRRPGVQRDGRSRAS